MAGKASLPCNAVVTGYSQLYYNSNIINKDLKLSPENKLSIGDNLSTLAGINYEDKGEE